MLASRSAYGDKYLCYIPIKYPLGYWAFSLFHIRQSYVPWPSRTAEGIFLSNQDYAELSFLFELSFLIMTYIFPLCFAIDF